MAKLNLSKNRTGQTVHLNNGTRIIYNVVIRKIVERPGEVTAVYTYGKVNTPVRQQDWDTRVWKQF